MVQLYRTFLAYSQLLRLDKPVGNFLLLWPTLWALWLATQGHPAPSVVLRFILGVFVMRAAGCAINDWADRKFDGLVKRTAGRPLVTGALPPKAALRAALLLTSFGAAIVLTFNVLTISLSVLAVFVVVSYPFLKRFFFFPQLYLGIAFSFGIGMAYSAVKNKVPIEALGLGLANVFWAMAYDTEYAMVDRDDDKSLGLRSSALTLGRFDVGFIVCCHMVSLSLLCGVGIFLELGRIFYMGLLGALGLSLYQFKRIKSREPNDCFHAFLNNAWWGAVVFAGIVFDTLSGRT